MTQPVEAISREQIWLWLEDIPDPEIPVLSIVDLGIVRDVSVCGGRVTVDVSPTYSGCPATEVIEQSIVSELKNKGLASVEVRRVLSPPWTTDWISEQGRDKLLAYGIVPPEGSASKRTVLGMPRNVACPRCGSDATRLVSEFGSTPCKASWRCVDCLEPFEYFKCI